MRGLIKRLSILISVLVVILGLSSCGNNKESIKTPVRDVNIVDTSVSLDSIFYSYNIETNDNVTTVEAQKLITREDFENINNLSEVSVGNDNFIDFDIVYDADTNIISITASMDNELGYLEAETIYGVAFTNEDGNIDAALDCDGEMILLSDLGGVSSIEECKWFKKICKTVKSFAKDVVETVVDVAVDTAAVVVAAAPAIATAVVVTAVAVAALPEVIIIGEGVAVAGTSVGIIAGGIAGIKASTLSIYSDYTEAVFAYANGIKEDLHEAIDDLFDGEATSTSTSETSDDITSDDDSFIDDDIKSAMGLYNLDVTKIKSLLDEFIEESKKYEYKKTVYLGAGKDKYKEIAEKEEAMWFGVSDTRWFELLDEYTPDGMWLINRAYLNYVISKKWEIVLVSNPDEYYDKINKKILVERFYAKELQYLNKRGADWHYEGPYWRVDKAW